MLRSGLNLPRRALGRGTAALDRVNRSVRPLVGTPAAFERSRVRSGAPESPLHDSTLGRHGHNFMPRAREMIDGMPNGPVQEPYAALAPSRLSRRPQEPRPSLRVHPGQIMPRQGLATKDPCARRHPGIGAGLKGPNAASSPPLLLRLKPASNSAVTPIGSRPKVATAAGPLGRANLDHSPEVAPARIRVTGSPACVTDKRASHRCDRKRPINRCTRETAYRRSANRLR